MNSDAMDKHRFFFEQHGYDLVADIYDEQDVHRIASSFDTLTSFSPNFRRSAELFAVRKFLVEFPDVAEIIFNQNLKSFLREIFGPDYFVVKSIYFDKPPQSNWFVSWHQDLTINVEEKKDVPGFVNWTKKQDVVSVQPPVEILENIVTIRIHLDDTDEQNGALKVIPGSHRKGICNPGAIEWQKEKEVSCNLKAGSIMLMKPLTFHASSRTVNGRRRRVIHIEFSNYRLPEPIQWAEFMSIH